MTEYLPLVDEHCKELDAPIAVLTLPWFLCLFVHCLPMGATLRVLDIFFACGRKVLFWVALSIFWLYEKDILNCTESMEVVFLLKEKLEVQSADQLIETTFRFSAVTGDKVEQLWAEHYPKVLKELNLSTREGEPVPPLDRQESEDITDHQDAPVEGLGATGSVIPSQKRFPMMNAYPQPSFHLHGSNQELRQVLQLARQSPEVSHTTASLIHLLREGFTGQILEQNTPTAHPDPPRGPV